MTASSGAAMGVVTTVVSSKDSGWRATHEALTRLARLRAGLDFEEGQQLRAAQLARVHERLGYGSFVEYIERLFGYAPRLTLEKLRVAQALADALLKGWFRGIDLVICRVARRILAPSGMCCGSKCRATSWQRFAKLLRSCAKKRAVRSTTTRCCS